MGVINTNPGSVRLLKGFSFPAPGIFSPHYTMDGSPKENLCPREGATRRPRQQSVGEVAIRTKG